MPDWVDFQGQLIRLTDERLRHILEHPEMAEMVSAIPETLLYPDVVAVSQSDDFVRLYYKRYEFTSVGDKLACVVTKQSDGGFFIITAYLTDKIKRGGILWQKNE
ncbi:MAG: hypothetical protein HY680_07740 [Chloroflexi bacterium]|nr:hypothetical protein [Chloroflexota bacterium]